MSELPEHNRDYEWFMSFRDKHQGEVSWLFGKGPSFEKYHQLRPSGIICTINEACYHVKDIDYAFCWYADRKDIKPSSGQVIDGSRGHHIRDFEEYRPDKRVIFMKHGTGELATSMLIWMGVREINLVGIDGVGKYSQEFEWKNESIDMDYANERRTSIKDRMKKMMKMAGVKCVDHSYDISPNRGLVVKGGRCSPSSSPASLY